MNDLTDKYQKALKQVENLQRQIEAFKSTTPSSDTAGQSIQGLELFLLRISGQAVIEYVNHAFISFCQVKREDLIGQDYRVLYKLKNQPLLSKIILMDDDGTETIEAMDNVGDNYVIKMTRARGRQDVVIENVTDQYKLRDYVSKYISSDLTDLSDEDLTTFKFPERRFMSLSFTSLKGFTRMSEALIPEQVRKTVNTYLESAIKAVEVNNATVDKIIGDEVMALYGAPKYYKDHALRALKTAMEQIENLEAVQKKFKERGGDMPGCGIGINTGEMVVGSIGSKTRKDYTVIGNAVNIAARLGKLAQEGEILLTESTLKAVLEVIPPDWKNIEEVFDAPDVSSRGDEADGVVPLKENIGKQIFIGPAGQPVMRFKYMFAVICKGMKEQVTVLSALGFKKSTAYEYLKDEALKYNDGIRTFGKYQLLKLLGRGGMGEVWKAKDSFGNKVAIKTLLTGDHATEAQLRRFMREADVMSKLYHRGICRIHEVGEVDGIRYIAMEYVKGVPLSKILEYKEEPEDEDGDDSALTATMEIKTLLIDLDDKNAEVPGPGEEDCVETPAVYNVFAENKSLPIIIKICEAIQFAHDHGVFHRDIKPQNIMICPGNEPVIMDFGIARTETGQAESAASGRRQIFGTIEYMAPEQANSQEGSDERSDIFSIGAVIYQMLTGRKHFTSSGNILQDITRLEDHEPITPRFYRKQISADMEAIILKALKNSPEERYSSTRQLGEDLKHYQASEPVAAQTSGRILYRVRKKILKHKTASVLVCLILAGLAGFAGYILFEKEKQWGNWVPVYQVDFPSENVDITQFEFMDGMNHEPVEPFEVTGMGMNVRPFRWCWLKGARDAKLFGNIRLVIEFRGRSRPEGLKIMINTVNEPTGSPYQSPPGHSVVYGAYHGTMDLIHRNEKGTGQSLFNSVSVLAEKNDRTRIMFEKAEDKFSYFLNGRKMLVMRDLLPDRGPEFNNLGFISFTDSLYIQSIKVFRLSLPEKASPLIAGNILRTRGKLQEAVDAYLTIAEDYFGTEVAEKSLLEAYITASGNEEMLGHLTQPIKSDFQAHYPHSLYRTRLLEIETIMLWEEGNYQAAIKNMELIYAADPNTQISRKLKLLPLPADVEQDLLSFFKRTRGLDGLCIRSENGFALKDVSGLDLVRLDMAGVGAQSLEPLQAMHLQWLRFSHNLLEDLTPLRGMPLKFLIGDNNRISNLSPLSGKALDLLYLKGNRIKDLAPLKGSNIKYLNLANNNITDLGPLKRLPLQDLTINYNKISDLGPLQGAKLNRLIADHNEITDLSPLQGMPLVSLCIQNNRISDLSSLKGMPLQYVFAGGNAVSSIEPLKGMSLAYLNLDDCSLENYDHFNRISVTNLVLSRNQLQKMVPLYSRDLKALSLDNNYLPSLAPLENLQLTSLSCSHNRIASLAPLKNMNLQMLNCQDNRLVSLAPFYQSPPDTFLFDNTTLPLSEISKVIKIWSKYPEYEYNTRYAEMVYHIRNRNIYRLRKMAGTFEGHHYLYVTRKMSWEDASVLCRRLRGHLVTISSREENDFLLSLMDDDYHAWMGITSHEGKWVWVDEGSLFYSNTDYLYEAAVYPTLLFSGRNQGGKWVVNPSIQETGFIIEWDS
ncbi:protein kinase [Fibrobacterota bacterium]